MVKLNRNYFYSLLKFSVTTVAVFLICRQVFHREQFENFIGVCYSAFNDVGKCSMLAIVILLMIVNWSVETIKWNYLIKEEIKLSFAKAGKGVLMGVALSFFTPNRVGEFAGRVIVLPDGKKLTGALAAIAGSLSQLIITLVAGLICFSLLFNSLSHFSVKVSFALIASCLLIGIPLVFFYFNLNMVSRIRLPFIKTEYIRKYLMVYDNYSRKQLLHVAILSSTRYVVFAIQYALLFKIAGLEISFVTAFLATGVIFLVMTVLPTIAVLEPALRGSVSLFILQNISDNQTAILVTSFAIWFINLVIPALAGSLIFLGERISRRETV